MEPGGHLPGIQSQTRSVGTNTGHRDLSKVASTNKQTKSPTFPGTNAILQRLSSTLGKDTHSPLRPARKCPLCLEGRTPACVQIGLGTPNPLDDDLHLQPGGS